MVDAQALLQATHPQPHASQSADLYRTEEQGDLGLPAEHEPSMRTWVGNRGSNVAGQARALSSTCIVTRPSKLT